MRFTFALAVALAASAARADEPPPLDVRVDGDAMPRSGSRDQTAAATVVGRERLTVPGQSAADVLAATAGAQVVRTGSSSDLATAQIRGATSAETPVYLAGVRLNDDVTGTADLSTVPLWMIRRVEVYRGTAPAEADRLGIGGAIFFDPIVPRGSTVGVGATAGSFDSGLGWAAGAVGDARASALVGVSLGGAKNDYPYVDDRGTRFTSADDVVRRRVNADSFGTDAWSISRARIGPTQLTAVINAFSREQGVTGLSLVPATDARARTSRLLAAIASKTDCSAQRDGSCALELVTTALVTGSTIDDPLHELALLTTSVHSAGDRVTETARLTERLSDTFAFGASFSEELERLAIDSVDLAPVRARSASERGAAFVTIDPVSRLELTALGAFACDGVSGPGTSGNLCTSPEPAARVGARFFVADGFDLAANAGRYVRAPTLGELYGVSPVVLGNTALVPEDGLSADIGARLAGGGRDVRFATQAFAFGRLANNLISYERSELGAIRPFNVGSARILGLELTGVLKAFNTLSAELALTALDPRDTTSTRQVKNDILPFQARLVAAPYLELGRDNPIALLDRAAVGARFWYRASRVADPAGLIVLPEDAELDLELMLSELGGRLRERLRVADVFDARSTDSIGLPLPGRSFYVSVEGWFPAPPK